MYVRVTTIQVIMSYDLPVTAKKNYTTAAHDMFSATQTTKAWGNINFVQVGSTAGLAC